MAQAAGAGCAAHRRGSAAASSPHRPPWQAPAAGAHPGRCRPTVPASPAGCSSAYGSRGSSSPGTSFWPGWPHPPDLSQPRTPAPDCDAR
ncbi:hypothetical protein G6F32_015860 [Rhizopus arrhizus]|nr:hypothetical protein G6F32_015860 [Rhizopus arrhizus]